MNDTPNKKSRLQREVPAANPGRTHNRRRRKNGKVLYYLVLVLLLGVLAVCLIGPCNGSTYMRYLYPVIACMPFAIGATITRSDLLWS